jgi:NAD(P)-dependent dehydrogenase (short-subunit alcohol dehydrogenase family)
MKLDLEGSRVLITGGSKGTGLACARAFLAEGTHVAIASRSEANLSTARAALGQVLTVAADLADAAAAHRMIDRVEGELGADRHPRHQCGRGACARRRNEATTRRVHDG